MNDLDVSRWRSVQELFFAVRELPFDARAEYLRSACGGDATLRREVERLLAAERANGILDQPTPVLPVSLLPPNDTAESTPLEGQVGPYLVTGEIGRGGMGVVYRAHDPRLRRDVALKFLPAARTKDRNAKARFIDEARAASALDHPHNCPVYDIGSTEDGRLYIAMAYCAGGSLATRLASGPLPVDEAVRVATQVASALHRAHEAGIVHRDIKPANIAFTEHGEARVLDFGLAVLGTDEWAAPRFAAGTPAYMAPEQVRGESVDRRTDVWALGAVLHEMLTGQRPFAGSRQDVLYAILHSAPNDVRSMRPDVPAALAGAVAKAMAKDPADRFASAAELGAAITNAVATSASASAAAPVRGRRVRAAILAGSAAVALAAAAFVVMRDPSADAAATVDESAVAILPFRVRGESSLQYLREGMVDLLAAKLTGEGGLRAADPRAVYAGWRRVVARETDDLPVDSGVALARRLGAGNVLVGDVVGSPGGIVVNASVMNARGRVVGRATAQGADTDLSALVDQLVAQLLTASAGEEPQRLGTLTSTSLPALRAYLEGQAAYRRGRYAGALEQFGRALDLDSTFALAGLGLSLADGWVGTGHARDRGRAVAWRWRDRLSPRDLALLVAHVGPAYPRDPTVREQLTTIEEALRLAPDRVELWYALGDLHFHFGRIFGGGDWTTQAERALRRAVEGDSGFAPAIHHLVGLYAMQARRDDLRALVATALAVAGEGSTADFVRWRVAEALGQGPLPVAALDSMATETIGWISLISQDEGIVVPLGERATQIRYERPTTSQDRFWRLLSVHAGALNGGRPRAAAALTENMQGMQSDSAFYLRLRVLSALYGDGDRAAGERAAAALGTVERDGAWRLNQCVRALWLLAAGTTSESTPPAPDGRAAALSPAEQHCESAVNAIRSSAQRSPAAARSVARLDEVTRTIAAELYLGDGHFDYAHIALARLLEASGDTAGALLAIRRRPYFIGWQPFLAASLRHEGRLAVVIGDREGAIRAYEHYLALRYAPEESLRASADSVRAELARLQSGR